MPRTSKLMLVAIVAGIVAMAVGVAVYHQPGGKRLSPAVESILEATEQFELLSLYPFRRGGPEENDETTHFHGYRILGKTVVGDAQTRAQLISALKLGITDSDMAAACFDPRHGIHATHGEKTADVLICFACGYVVIYLDGKELPTEDFGSLQQPLFDDVLRSANVKLAPKH